ncbi:MAG TPA: HEAT repeat domain-containing protein [Methanosarcinaceae archaeon]|nr:HEAT repeat domain-containing protein [Methanosarcinaceae archaeon]
MWQFYIKFPLLYFEITPQKKRAVEDEDNYVTMAAVQALAQGWHDDANILDVLKDRAENDDNKEVKKVAAKMMRHYGIK